MTFDFTPQWRTTNAPARPESGEVHVWSLPLQISKAHRQALWEVLSEDEQTRARRFFSDEHRRRFVACRGRVRCILGRYLGLNPAALTFHYSGLGKPALNLDEGFPDLAFNVTHSGELALLAVGVDGELGADVEHHREVRNMHGLAQRFFSKTESTGLFQLTPDSQAAAFFRIWTRKEAILKATGKGLTFPLDRLTVSFGEDEPAALVSLGDDPVEAQHWTLLHLIPEPDYIAAIATRYAPNAVRYWTWRDELA